MLKHNILSEMKKKVPTYFYYKNGRLVFILLIVYMASGAFVWAQHNKGLTSPGFQAAYDYIGISTEQKDYDWWFEETQGIANDKYYWYFSKNDDPFVYKVSYSEHLNEDFGYIPQSAKLKPGPDIGACGHIGDIDCFTYNGEGYMIAPYEKCGDTGPEFAAIFLTADINGDGSELQPIAVFPVGYKNAAWAAVNEANYNIYVGSSTAGIMEFVVDWDLLTSGDFNTYSLGDEDELNLPTFILNASCMILTDENGDLFTTNEGGYDSMTLFQQGGDFSTDGKLLYLLTGNETDAHCAANEKSIHVFDTSTWSRIKRSTKESGLFQYQTEHCGILSEASQEPEGISYYDLNGISEEYYNPDMPGGELHVILLFNGIKQELPILPDINEPDKVSIKHYTGIIEVKPIDYPRLVNIYRLVHFEPPGEDDIPSMLEYTFNNYTGEGVDDIYTNVFDFSGHGAWDGAVINMYPGTYNERNLHLDGSVHSVKIVATHGEAIISSK